jgi:hypothetical protein
MVFPGVKPEQMEAIELEVCQALIHIFEDVTGREPFNSQAFQVI